MPKTGLRRQLGALACMTAMLTNTAAVSADDGWQERLKALENGATSNLDFTAYQIAQAAAVKDFDIPAQPLANAIALFGQQSGLQVSVDADLIRNANSVGVKGRLAAEDALQRLLDGSGFTYRMEPDQTVTLVALPASQSGPVKLAPVEVTGEAETATSPVDGYVAHRSATGTKTDTLLIETPQSISVIPRQRIEDQQPQSVAEALNYTAGVKADNYGTDSRFDWVSFRGFEAYTPGFFQDGLAARNNNTWAVWRTEPYGVERIEVLRGPSSVLYGQNSPGGMLNIISKRPLDEPFHELQFLAGSNERFQGAFDLSGPVDKEKTFLYRIIGLARDSETQVDYVDDNRQFIAPSFTWQPNEDSSLTVLTHFQREDIGTTLGFLPASGTLLNNPHGEIPRSRFTGEPDYDHFDKTEWSVGYLLEHAFDETWTVRQNARFGQIDMDLGQVYGAAMDADERSLLRNVFTSDEKVNAFSIDNQVQAAFDTGPVAHTALLGLDFQRHHFRQKSGFDAGPPLDIYDPDYGADIVDPPLYLDADITLQQTGVYLQEQAKLFDQLVLVLGGRQDWATIDTKDYLAADRIEQKDDDFTWRGGLVYLSPIGLAPYFSYSESFFPTATLGADGQPLKPETGRQYEAGLKFQPEGIDSFITFAAFDIRRQNYVTYDENFVAQQTGEIHSRGLELEAQMSLMDGLNMTAAYTWLPTFKVTKSADITELGRRVPSVPEHMASLWADYRFQQGPLEGLGFGGGVRYVGQTEGNSHNDKAMEVPGYTLFDAAMSYELEGVKAQLNVKNIADKRYVGSCWDTCYYGSGRVFIGTITYRW
jgi:iron complex outermembrane receptor protein